MIYLKFQENILKLRQKCNRLFVFNQIPKIVIDVDIHINKWMDTDLFIIYRL